jgi:FkbM family methyltransferase
LNALALQLLDPLRKAAVAFPRGSLVRSGCVVLLKKAAAYRRLMASLDEIRPLDRPDLSFEPVDSMVMDAVYWLGIQGYEGVLADVWARLCAEACNILEIGGNVGLYSVIGGKAARDVYTVVEPVPEVATILRANLRRNGLDRVEMIEAAAIPENEICDVCLNLPDEGRLAPVGAHLIRGVEIDDRNTLRQIQVKGLPFGGLAQGRDLIKIDAEGVEDALLAAAMHCIERNRPTLVIEVLPEAERLAQTIASIARRFDYAITVVPAYGSNALQSVRPDEFSSTTPVKFNSKDVVLSQGAL